MKMSRLTGLMMALVLTCSAAVSFAIDASKVTDPKVKGAIEEINRKQAVIKEIAIGDVRTTQTKGSETLIALTGKSYYRVPDLFCNQFTAVAGMSAGSVSGTASDGKTLWQLTIASPALIENMINRMKANRMPQTEIDTNVKKLKVECSKLDLDKLRAAGLYDPAASITPMHPDAIYPADQWRLESETATTWTFVSPAEQKGSNKFTFSKENGLCVVTQSVRYIDSTPMLGTTALGKIEVNPNPPIADSVFKFTPPAGVEPTDMTEMRLKAKPRK